jgi:hypothetical protein
VVAALVAFEMLLSIERRGFEGRSRAGYALENVLNLVGETALRVSSRRLAPLPKLRVVLTVLMESLGRCPAAGPRGIIGNEVVMLDGGADDEEKGGGIECGNDIVESIVTCTVD